MKHPIQYIKDNRFVGNDIVRYLLDNGGIGLNKLAILPFSNDDREQFAQLIGYSLSGYANLGYVSEATFNAASLMSDGENNELLARIESLEETLKEIRKHLKGAACEAFKIHEDDLSC